MPIYMVIKTETITRIEVWRVAANNDGDAIRDARDDNARACLEIVGEPVREVKWTVAQEKM